jgi:hypothetical protein
MYYPHAYNVVKCIYKPVSVAQLLAYIIYIMYIGEEPSGINMMNIFLQLVNQLVVRGVYQPV